VNATLSAEPPVAVPKVGSVRLQTLAEHRRSREGRCCWGFSDARMMTPSMRSSSRR